MTDIEFAINEYLPYIDVSSCDYEDWVKVGMTMKNIGLSASDWDNWSSNDPRYKNGECERKWSSFGGNGLTVATLGDMAKQGGWTTNTHYPLEWDSEIGSKGEIVDLNWLEHENIPVPSFWNPIKEIITYLNLLFEPDEYVSYVSEYYDNGKKLVPKKGNYDRTASRLLKDLSTSFCIQEVFGDYNESVGVWIRFNPLDGQGIKDKNVTNYRYALIESDVISIEKQYAIYKELELPIAVLVHSGNKSLHAIVKIDAKDKDEYTARVNTLFNICSKNGLSIDTQNRNASRLSRMPGILRDGKKQYIVDSNIGMENWDTWINWIEEQTDNLPDFEALPLEVNIPEKSPELIEGILREGHKMLLAGCSKAGKSFLLINLAISIGEGVKWLDKQCKKGKVLYINLELDTASCFHRFKDEYLAHGIEYNKSKNIDIWNLRGNAVPMDQLAPKLIRRAVKKKYSAIIIDPIYKVITGDENAADKMAHFCNQFDKICNVLNSAVIYCHHHSKGSQGQKNSSDRASGSGVFARDPDALIDLIELNINEDLREVLLNNKIEPYITNFLNEFKIEADISQDITCVAEQYIKEAHKYIKPPILELFLKGIYDIRRTVKSLTAWRIEGTLREFARFEPIKCFFEFPYHSKDAKNLLIDAKAEGEEPIWVKKKTKTKTKQEKTSELTIAFESCAFNGDPVTLRSLASYLGCSTATVRRKVKDNLMFMLDNGIITKKGKTI